MNKKFFKKLALLMALLTVFSSFALVGCGKADEEDNKTTTTVAVSTEDEAAVTDSDSSEPEPEFAILKNSYKTAEAFDLTGKSVPLETVFGTGYAKNGDELILNDDGTFTMYIGVYANPDSVKGTYKVKSMTEVEFLFDDDTTKSAVVTVIDGDYNAVELRIPMHEEYNVIFR